MKRFIWGIAVVAIATALALVGIVKADNDHDRDDRFEFKPDTLVLSRSVYAGTASTVTAGTTTLPPGCIAGTVVLPTIPNPAVKTNVAVACGVASDNGEYPNTNDAHNVWNNDSVDGSFGVTSPIFLDNITTNGKLLDTLPIPTHLLVTSFSSKSELAVNRSLDGKSITFVGYRGGPGCPATTFVAGIGTPGIVSGPVSPTAPNLLDVSNSNTPGVCDPTNPVVSSGGATPTAYYRTVAEVDADGHVRITEGNAYSGNNGRAAIKGHWTYYLAGNDNNGGLSSKSEKPVQMGLSNTQVGINLVTSTGAELLVPFQAMPPAPPNINMIGDFEIGQPSVGYPSPPAPDKPGKDNNFRGLTIFDNTLYMTKGSGGNGINTVYQVGNHGVLPSGTTAQLEALPITILPGFTTTLASGEGLDLKKGHAVAFPFGLYFANANTLYVCDEGDPTVVQGQMINGQPNVATLGTIATAGVQKWHFDGTTWHMLYVLQNGLNIGFPYAVGDYPAALNPATGGCRNITGRVNRDGTVSIYAVTSTLSFNADQGADPNKLVRVYDLLSATSLPLPAGDGDHDKDDSLGVFTTIRAAQAGEVLRGISFAPADRDDDHDGDLDRDHDHDRDDHDKR